MSNENDEALRFMEHMINSYSDVHNSRYWKEITPLIMEKAKGQCLDLGCGPGLLLRDVYRRFKSKNLIGIDLSQLMLKKAEEYLQSEDGINYQLIQQHLQENMDLPTENDVIFSSRVLRSIEDSLGILSSIHQSLNSNGYLVILDWDRQSLSTYRNWFRSNKLFNERSFQDIVRLYRNFSKYSIDDWSNLLTYTGFLVEHTFQLDPVHIVVIAQRK